MTDDGQIATPSRLKVSQAAKAVGRARSTLNRDIANGKLSVTRTGTGQPYIEIAELERAYGKVTVRTVETPTESVPIGHDATGKIIPDSAVLHREIDLLRERLADKDETIADLRQRLDRESEERRRLTALLAPPSVDQRQIEPKRRWWPWRKA